MDDGVRATRHNTSIIPLNKMIVLLFSFLFMVLPCLKEKEDGSPSPL